MSLIPHEFFPRTMFDTNFGPRALDMFDPFDQLDAPINNMFHWFERPVLRALAPPQKYRVTLDCAGFAPASIRTEIAGDKLIVSGKEGEAAKGAEEDHSLRTFKRTFNLPKLVEKDLMTSFMDQNGTLVIDIPYKMDESGQLSEDMLPKVVDDGHGHKTANMDLVLPLHVDPSHVQVTAKDHDIIVKAKDHRETRDSVSNVSYYRRSKMPVNADLKGMKCVADGNKLHVTAPLSDHALPSVRDRIPILDK